MWHACGYALCMWHSANSVTAGAVCICRLGCVRMQCATYRGVRFDGHGCSGRFASTGNSATPQYRLLSGSGYQGRLAWGVGIHPASFTLALGLTLASSLWCGVTRYLHSGVLECPLFICFPGRPVFHQACVCSVHVACSVYAAFLCSAACDAPHACGCGDDVVCGHAASVHRAGGMRQCCEHPFCGVHVPSDVHAV